MDSNASLSRRVIIVGGGIIGCSIAYELSLRGYQPTIIEKEDTVASGASGKAGGFLSKTWNDKSAVGPLTRRSYELHKEHGKTFENTLYRSMDTWSVSVHPRGASKDFASENMKWLDSGNCSGLSHLCGEDSSAQVHPLHYCEAIFAKSVERGTKFVRGEVVNFHRTGSTSSSLLDGICGVEMIDPEGNRVIVDGDVIVVAMGCWSGTLLDSLFQSLTTPVMSAIRATSIVLKPSGEVPNVALFTDWFTPGEDCSFDPEVYPRPDGTLYICAKADLVDIPYEGTVAVVPDVETTNRIVQYAAQLSPLLNDVPVLTTQACLLPTTIDDIPIIGELIPGKLLVATGHSCWGILNAPATGEAIAQIIHEGKSDLNLEAFDPRRFL